jgi:hypothetical protein
MSTLSKEEIEALKSVGVIAENWFAVSYNENAMPTALFCNEDYAKAYRDQFMATSIVAPWPMVIKDFRKKGIV